MPLWFAAQKSGGWINQISQVPTIQWILISFSLCFSAFFSMAETALTAITHVKMEQLVEKDKAKFGHFSLWLNMPNQILTTILIGNNLVNILATAIATSIAQKVFQQSGIAIAVGCMTFIILIMGEIIPKTFAKHHAIGVATRILPLLKLVYWLFLPVTKVLVKLATFIVKIFGGNMKATGPFVTEEDLQYMIDVSKRGGVLDDEKEKMLKSVFEFDDITSREVMQPRTKIQWLSYDATFDEAIELAVSSPYSRIPVYRDNMDQVEGTLYLRDLFRLRLSSENQGSKREWTSLLRSSFFVPSTMNISDLLSEFQKRQSHQAIVVDEFGGTMGLVTLEDVLEEIVGEIHDEYDREEQELIILEEGVWDVHAQMTIRDLEEHLNVEFPDDGDFETLGGFLTADAGMVPSKGETLCWNGHEFRIQEGDEKHIKRVLISRLSQTASIEI